MKAGIYVLNYFYMDEIIENINSINGPRELEILPNVCSKQTSKENEHLMVNLENLNKALSGEPTYLTVICYDIYKNRINSGKENFSAKIHLKYDDGKITEINAKTNDNGDGTYKIEFTPPYKGKYDIRVLLNKEEYYNLSNFEIEDLSCPEEKPIRCTNKIELCVKNPEECIDSNPEIKCPPDSPLGCRVNGNLTCVKSNTDCDCPENIKDVSNPFIKCPSTKVCIPKSLFEELCFDPYEIDCEKLNPNYPIYNKDGICRIKVESPSFRVCPLGLTLCADLTCRKNIFGCRFDFKKCANDQMRCSDLSCVKNQKDCPSTIVCSKPEQYVCPDGICVNIEAECKILPKCGKDFPYLCSQNVCAKTKENCPKSISCGHGRALCSDMICRTTCRE